MGASRVILTGLLAGACSCPAKAHSRQCFQRVFWGMFDAPPRLEGSEGWGLPSLAFGLESQHDA